MKHQLRAHGATLEARGRWRRPQRTKAGSGSVWPDPLQVLLLEAGLLDGSSATDAWDQWRSRVDLEAVDHSSAQLLSLAYRNLQRLGVRDETHEKLKLQYMVTWAKNQKIFRRLSQTLQVLHTSQIETLVMKGTALSSLYYQDEGVRGMSDFDVLVPEKQFYDAARLLQEHGWHPWYFDPRHFDTRFLHAIAFLDPEGNSVDLHCHVLVESCERHADVSFWEASQPLQIHEVGTRTLCASDHLIQACAHGLVWVKSPPVRWVADAVTLLRVAADEIEWDRVVRLSVERGVALKVAATLDYLSRNFVPEIPADAVATLRAASASRADRRRYQMWVRSKRGRPVSLFEYHWSMFNRGIGRVGPVKRVVLIPQYLRFWGRTDRLWTIPANLAVTAWRIVGHRLGLYQYWDDT